MEPPYTISYVTAFIDIYADQAVKDFIKKPNTMRYETFRLLAKGCSTGEPTQGCSTGEPTQGNQQTKSKIPIIVFVDPESAKIVAEFQHECNLHIVPIYYDELITYQDIKDLDLELPGSRCTKKDTVEFMTIMNAKAEFMKRAKDINPFHTHHFGWMDFSLGYVFKDHVNTYKYLQDICHRPLQTSLYTVPGCWQKGMGIHYIDQSINWRFCGGFYIADANSVEDFYNLYRTHYRRMLKDKKKIIWETNIWALLELDHGWKPTWFLADHNDSICKIPESCFI